jgi:O-methyltransferase involved in polyketide biosynthesis
MRGSEAISPTAHYTGYVWHRHGLSHPELVTRRGRLLFEAWRPSMVLTRVLGASDLENYLLARHATIDRLLSRAIEEEGLTQVIEVACGLSARGWRFMDRYGDRLTYVEGDLSDMAELKRDALARIGSLGERHRVEELDALRDDGPGSLAAVADSLNPGEPLAIITEGLLGYLERPDVLDMWERFARTLSGFRSGVYLADTYFAEDMRRLYIQAFLAALGAFVRGRVHVHFADASEARALLAAAGFDRPGVLPADDHGPGSQLARIIDAETAGSG